MDLHSGHRHRLRQRYLLNGFKNLSDCVVLEILLGYAIPRKDTSKLASELLEKFGSLRNVMSAPYQELVAIHGISENTAVLLGLMNDLTCGCDGENSRYKDIWLTTPELMADFFIPLFKMSNTESLFVACLSNNMKLVYFAKLYEGDFNSVKFQIRDITAAAIQSNTSKVILAHNHINGSSVPSSIDIDTTSRIRDSLSSNSIELYEHIVVRGEEWTAMMRYMKDRKNTYFD